MWSGLVWTVNKNYLDSEYIEFDGFTEDSYGIHAYINILDKCEMSHGLTDGHTHTVERRVVFCLCRIRNRSYQAASNSTSFIQSLAITLSQGGATGSENFTDQTLG